MPNVVTVRCPKVAMRKISIGDVMGLSWTSTRRRGGVVQHRQRIDDGEAYIQSCTPKPTAIARSRYFVVKDDTMMPTPRPSSMTSSTTNGTASTHSGKGDAAARGKEVHPEDQVHDRLNAEVDQACQHR